MEGLLDGHLIPGAKKTEGTEESQVFYLKMKVSIVSSLVLINFNIIICIRK